MWNDDLLKDIVFQNATLPCEKELLQDHTDLVQDLGMDSIAVVNLFADLEEQFGIEIDVREIRLPILNRYEWLKEYILGRIAAAASAKEGGA